MLRTGGHSFCGAVCSGRRALGQAAGQPLKPRRPKARRRHFGRPVLGRPVRRISPAFHRRARAACERHGLPQRLSGHAATETCPGHSTILTGSHPTHTGIIANNWIDQSLARSDKTVYCAEDERVPGSSTTSYTVSPMHLRVPTLGDLMKQRSPQSRNVAVAGKDRAAVMMGGHNVDQRWYWDGKTFVTDLQVGPVPATITRANSAVAAAIATAREPLQVAAVVPGQGRARSPCRPTCRSASGAFARAAGDVRGFSRFARIRRRGARACRRAGPRDEARPRRGARRSRRSAYRRPIMSATASAPAARKCACSCSRSTAISATSSRCSTAEGIDYAVVADRRSWRDRHSRARAADGCRRRPRGSIPALGLRQVGKAIAGQARADRPGVCSATSPMTCGIDRALQAARSDRGWREAHRRLSRRTRRSRRCSPQARSRRLPMPTEIAGQMDADRSGSAPRSIPSVRAISMSCSSTTCIADRQARRGSSRPTAASWDYDRRVPILFWRQGMQPRRSRRTQIRPYIMPTAGRR